MNHILIGINYLDPGSGSLLIQIFAAGLLGGIGILLKIFWGRIKAFVKGEKYLPPLPEGDEKEQGDAVEDKNVEQ